MGLIIYQISDISINTKSIREVTRIQNLKAKDEFCDILTTDSMGNVWGQETTVFVLILGI